MQHKVERIKALLETVTAEAEKVIGPAPWWKKYVKYQLTKYPIKVPEDQVEINLTGDIDTHAVMVWIDPKSGRRVYSYTKTFAANQAAQKWERTSKMSADKVENFRIITARTLTGKADDKVKQAAAVVSIIAQTGLRPGSQIGFAETGNRGVLTLAPENIKIKGDKVVLTFVGKSYQENLAEIEDGPLAHYLQGKVASRKGEDFVFDVPRYLVDDFYKRILKMGTFKIKDLRTHMAGQLAKEILENDPLPPPPLPKKPGEIKKAVKNKLKHVFDLVSKKLNNSPAMAKGSYVNPAIISNWLTDVGIQPELVSSVGVPYKDEIVEDETIGFDGEVPVYKLPAWWDRDDIELVATTGV